MSARKRKNGPCVTHEECAQAMEPLRTTLQDVKNAIVGKDLRGGLVQQVNNLDNKVTNIVTEFEAERADAKKENEEKRKENFRWKLAALSFAFSFLGFLLEYAVNHFAH